MGIPVKSGERTSILRKKLADMGINDFHIEETNHVEENNASTLITDAIKINLQELNPNIVFAVTQQLQPNGEKELPPKNLEKEDNNR